MQGKDTVLFIDDMYKNRSTRFTEHCPSQRADRNGIKVLFSTSGKDISGVIRSTYYKNGARNIIMNLKENLGYEGVMEMADNSDFRIRKLTPLECYRLMGFSDEDYLAAKLGSREKAKYYIDKYENNEEFGHLYMMQKSELKEQSKMSNTQLYKQAGNSIVVDVLYYIYKNLYEAMPYLFEDLKVGSYFSGIGAFESGLDRLYDEIKVVG